MEFLETLAICRRTAGLSQVAVDDDDAIRMPAECEGALPESVLALGALGVFQDLTRRRLQDIVHGIQLCGFRCWSRSHRTCTGPHPGGQSLAQKNDEAEAAAGGLTQYVRSQLLVTSHPIFPGCGLRQHFVHRGFF